MADIEDCGYLSVDELLVVSEQSVGRRISVWGYLDIDAGSILYPAVDSHRERVLDPLGPSAPIQSVYRRVRLDHFRPGAIAYKQIEACDRRYVIVTGTVNNVLKNEMAIDVSRIRAAP